MRLQLPVRSASGDLMQCWSHRTVKSAPLFRAFWARLSSSKLFVGGLCYDTNETILKDAFQKYGEIIEEFEGKPCRNLMGIPPDLSPKVGVFSGGPPPSAPVPIFMQFMMLDVKAVKIICDRVSGKSNGYGFVHFDSEVAASTALTQMNGQMVDGRSIRISYAHK